MVKDHSDTEKGNPLSPHRLLLSASSQRLDVIYHGLRYTSRGALAGTRNSSKRIINRRMSEYDYFANFIHVEIRILI